MLLTVTIALLVVLIFIVATLVTLRGKSALNLTFAVFSYTISAWIVANYIGANFKAYNFSRYFVHADFAIGVLAAFTFWFFSVMLLKGVTKPSWYDTLQRRLLYIFSGFVLIAIVISLTPWAVTVSKPAGSEVVVDYNSGFLFYTLLLGTMLIAGLFNLGATLVYSRGTVRKQMVAISRGFIIGALFLGFANLILPQLTTSEHINLVGGNLSYVGILAFITATSYAIIRHRLFDLRLVVARSLAYVGSLGFVALLYGLLVMGTASLLFDLSFPVLTLAYLIVATAIMALTFSRIKKWFDKQTNKLFYQDAYEPQELFAELNKTLVSSLDTKVLMNHSISIIEAALKPEFVAIGFAGAKGQYRIFSSRKVEFSEETIKYVRSTTPHISHKVIIADYLEDEHFLKLKNVMVENNVGALVRLTQDVTHAEEGMGYLILGNKKSGNPYTHQDVRTLETVANELYIAVQNALRFEEIQQFNLTLQEKVDEATRKLRASNEKLRKLDETKDEFISMASHQLRTPLTSVKGYLSMVLEGDAGELKPQQAELLKQSFLSSERMVNLIADLLNLSRLNTGKFVIESAPTDLRNVVEAELAQLSEAAKAKDIELKYDRPASFPSLMLDENKIHQVVMNFVDNAIYYTPPGGEITVSLSETPTAVEYRVSDTGIGVPKALQHRLFTKFYRAENARRMRPDGTGLGLFMAKKVIIAQGGSILFDSTEGKGSTFGFRFNKSALAAAEQPAETTAAQA